MNYTREDKIREDEINMEATIKTILVILTIVLLVVILS